ncbi:MAG TPA: T9SS type A sorting domain-containing protein, partial [Flavobacterium sp.]|nr:T9SS type A sorting domain-containing protein [Flavobacterium sp.]
SNPSNTIVCESDQTSTGGTANNAPSLAMTQQLANCTTLYSPLQTTLSNAYASDYVPFEAKGDIITGFYETPVSGNQHTVNDTFANIDPVYVFNVGKAAVGALQHFAVATSVLSTNETDVNKLESIKIYPNPAKDILNIELPANIKNFSLEINDMSGKLISTHGNESKINVSKLPNGVYLCTIKSDGETITKKIIIDK